MEVELRGEKCEASQQQTTHYKWVFCVAVPSDDITTRPAFLSEDPDLSDLSDPSDQTLPPDPRLRFLIPESSRSILTSQDLNFAAAAPPSLLRNYPAPPEEEEEEGVRVGGWRVRTGEGGRLNKQRSP